MNKNVYFQNRIYLNVNYDYEIPSIITDEHKLFAISIPILSNHNFEDGQVVVEGEDYNIEFVNSILLTDSEMYQYKVAIPINQIK